MNRTGSSGHLQALSAISSTPSAADSDIIVHFPHESDVQSSVSDKVSDVFSRFKTEINLLRSAIHDSNARMAAVSTLDKEKNAAWQFLCSIRNTLTPISVLPPEVLTLVFHFISLDEPPYFRKQNVGWIRVTHVCRHWRQVAMDNSSLWARISGIPTNIEWIYETIARARNAPLGIDVNLYQASNSELQVLPVLSLHLSHTRKLRMKNLFNLNSDSLRDLCGREAPALEHFELEFIGNYPFSFSDLGGTTLFKGQAPILRTFSLTDFIIPWSLIPRGQLTQLKIVFSNETIITPDVLPHGNLSEFIDLLVNCPHLEFLVLESCLPSQIAHSPCDQAIYLPRLSRLFLDGPSSRIANLLKMLKIPPTTILHLFCFSGNDFTPIDHFLLPVPSTPFQRPASVEFKKLDIAVSLTGSFEVNASTSLSTSRIHQCDDDFVLFFDGLPEHGNWTDYIKRVCNMLHISNLEFLSISAPLLVNPINWVEVFERCTKVAAMQVSGRGTSNLVRALATPKVTNSGRGGGVEAVGHGNEDGTPAQATWSSAPAPIFPKLAFMLLMKMNFAENDPSSGILSGVVQEVLRERTAMVADGTLKVLRIESCRAISAKHVKALEKLVPKFHWDGKEDFSEKYEEDGAGGGPWWEESFDGAL